MVDRVFGCSVAYEVLSPSNKPTVDAGFCRDTWSGSGLEPSGIPGLLVSREVAVPAPGVLEASLPVFTLRLGHLTLYLLKRCKIQCCFPGVCFSERSPRVRRMWRADKAVVATKVILLVHQSLSLQVEREE